MAGALGVELGGQAYYGGEIEFRPRMGYPQMPLDLRALRTARSLMWAATGLTLLALILIRALVDWVWDG